MKHIKFRKICLQIFLFLFLVSYKYYSDDDMMMMKRVGHRKKWTKIDQKMDHSDE